MPDALIQTVRPNRPFFLEAECCGERIWIMEAPTEPLLIRCKQCGRPQMILPPGVVR